MQLKKIAFKNAKEVRKFWIKINKVVAFKQKLDADAVRQKVVLDFCFAVESRAHVSVPGDGQAFGVPCEANRAIHE